MKALWFMWKWWRQLRWSSWNPPTGIDSHKWESKVEFYGSLWKFKE